MSRRGENIRKRADGRWEGRYKVYGIKSERTVYRSVYGKTYREVKEKLLQQIKLTDNMVLKRKNTELNNSKQLLFGNLAEEWLSDIKAKRKHPTYVKYAFIYDKYLKQQLSDCEITSLSCSEINALIWGANDYPAAELSESIHKSIYCVMNQIFSYAVLHYQTQDIHLKRPSSKSHARQIEVINHSEQSRLFRFLCEDMDVSKMGIILCISTGLRLGEICSLKWKDIDLEQRVLHINSTVQRIAVENEATKTILLESEPKSRLSRREIPVSDQVAALLTKFRVKGDYVLCGYKPMEPRTYQKRFRSYLKAAGLREYNFHVLRHTFATNCIDNGMDVKSLSEILGHSDVRITLNRYVHPTLDTKRKYMDALSLIYGQYCGQKAGNM